MRNLIKSEIYKLFHGKELIICIVAVILFSIITIVFGGYENGKTALTAESREIIGLVICTLFAVSYIGKDFTAKTVHPALTAGNKPASAPPPCFQTFVRLDKLVNKKYVFYDIE